MKTEGGNTTNNNINCSLKVKGHSEVVRITIQIQSRAQPQKRQSECYSMFSITLPVSVL